MTFKTIIIGLAIIFLIRIIYKFFLPVFRIVRTARKAMNDIRAQQSHYHDTPSSGGDTRSGHDSAHQQARTSKNTTSIEGEYIDFEEVK